MDVADHLRAGAEAWPGIVVAADRFAEELARRGTPIDQVKGADLYLAIACTDGNEQAIAIVTEMLAGEIRFASSKTTATRDQLAEVGSRLSKVLFVDEPERPAALRGYSARGDLRAYLRVMATRDLVKVVNRGRREVGIDDDDFIDRIVPRSDPELSVLRAHYREVVDDAMRAALLGLDERERALLRYAFVDGLNVDAVGKLYNVHRATAARWISAAREELGKRIRKELASKLSISVDEIDSIVRLVQSRIDVSIDRVLRA